MNKILKSLGLLVLVLTVFTTFSCSSDDEDNTPAAKLVAGLYSGWTKGDCQYFKNRTQNGESVAISSNDDGTIDVKLTSQMWGEAPAEESVAGLKLRRSLASANL